MADETKLKDSPENTDVQVAKSSDSGQVAKVELDLDDAPFLQEEKKPEAPATPAEGEAPAPDAAAAAPPPNKKKKLIIVAGAGVLLLLVIGAAVWWFVLRTPPPPSTPANKPEVVVVPSKPPVVQNQSFIKEFAPFLVTFSNDKKGTRFLVCKFSTLSGSQNTGREIDRNMISLRDAVYYYLHGKDIDYLLSASNTPAIKKDLVSVLNGYLTQGRIEDVLLESYLNE